MNHGGTETQGIGRCRGDLSSRCIALVILSGVLSVASVQAANSSGSRPTAGPRSQAKARITIKPAGKPNRPGTSGGANNIPVRDNPGAHQAALQAERQFARQTMQKLQVRFAEVETAHFVIWTNLGPAHHSLLSNQCEAMYSALQRIFQVPADQPVFLGKCGVFVLSNQEQFKGFSRLCQEIPPERVETAVGYHIGMPDGRVRIIGFWPGNAQQLAETLVHEGAHGFLFRYRSTGRVDCWFNEGLAEHAVALVFGTQSDEGRDAMQDAAEAARNDRQLLGRIMEATDHLPGEYYPVAQSAVAFLVQTNPNAFAKLVQSLKEGSDFAQALQQTYNASLPEFETHWRQWLLRAAQSGRPVY